MTATNVPLLTRFWLSLVCAFRVLFDAHFAAQVAELGRPRSQLQAAEPPVVPQTSPKASVAAGAASGAPAAGPSGALQLLALLQREGRFLDFVQQDITSFADADIGAAARLVHEGCQRALHAHARVVSVRGEAEGARLTLERATEEVKLVGNVAGSAPYRGVLRHRGWRVEDLTLPTVVGSYDQRLVAPAELELT
jgi:hypothetical protein